MSLASHRHRWAGPTAIDADEQCDPLPARNPQ